MLAGPVGVADGAGAAYVFRNVRLDCDGNGVPDVCDVSCQAVNPVTGQSCFIDYNSTFGIQADCNGNAVPDVCEPDCNSNGVANECELFQGAILLSADFESGLPAGWSASGLWHVTDACARPGACDPSSWAYFGRDGDCDFDTNGAVAGWLTAPQLTIPAGVTTATLIYCSIYEGEGGAAPTGLDAAWLAVNGVVTDDVGTTGAVGVWETRTVDLNAYIGQVVTLSWEFDSRDGSFNPKFRE